MFQQIAKSLFQLLRKTYWLWIIVIWSGFQLICRHDTLEKRNSVAGIIGGLGFGTLLFGVIYSHIRINKKS
ncbi:MAG: hypothetical protein ACK4LB_01240 [Spirosomataceae bacterium]